MAATPRTDLDVALLLVDAANVYAKARYKLGDLRRSDGTPSGGLYGAIRAVRSAVRRFEPEQVYVCFEGRESTLSRRTLDADYKADRLPGRDTFQVDHIEELKRWTTLACHFAVEAPGCEADDVIAHIAKDLEPWKEHAVIISSDHDFKKLLNPFVHLCRDSTTGDLYTASDLMRDLGVTGSQYAMMSCITGDASDNVKGVPGIGPKKALKLLQEAEWDLFRAAQHPRCVDHFDAIMRNFETLNFVRKPAIKISRPKDFPDDMVDRIALNEFYRKWEFESLVVENV
jgi:DNA polymerase-1